MKSSKRAARPQEDSEDSDEVVGASDEEDESELESEVDGSESDNGDEVEVEEDEDEDEDDSEDEDMETDDDDDDDDGGRRMNVEDDVDDLVYDVYNLTACNYHTLPSMDDDEKEIVLKENATRATQLLINKIFNCPTEQSDAGPLAVLPSELFKLPREKRIPEAKPETKWEKFAREKGIKNKKRERMIFDEETQEYRPRFGYKRANNGIEDIPIVEIKNGQDPYADPWAEERKEKKARVTKNNKQHLKNQRRNGSYTPASVPGLPIDLINKDKKRGKEGIKQALQLAQHSTASLGRFDDMRKGEPARKVKGKKQSFRANILSSHDDIATMKSNLRIVHDKVEKKMKGITNSLAAYEGIIPDAPTDKFKQKKGKGKVSTLSKRKK